MKMFWITATNLSFREVTCPPREALRAAHLLPYQMMGKQNLSLCSDSSSRPSILRIILLRTERSPGFSSNICIYVSGKQCSSIKALLVCIYQYSSTYLSASYLISESGVLWFVWRNDQKNWFRFWRPWTSRHCLLLLIVGTDVVPSEWRLLHYSLL